MSTTSQHFNHILAHLPVSNEFFTEQESHQQQSPQNDHDGILETLLGLIEKIIDLATNGRDTCARRGVTFDNLMDQFDFLHHDASVLMQQIRTKFAMNMVDPDLFADLHQRLSKAVNCMGSYMHGLTDNELSPTIDFPGRLERRLKNAREWFTGAKEMIRLCVASLV